MNVIQQETAAKIWHCYREISAAKKLLQDMEDKKKQYPNDPHALFLKNTFGCGQNLQLGISMGNNGHRIFDVSPDLAGAVIKSHIAAKQAELTGVNEQARILLSWLLCKESPMPKILPNFLWNCNICFVVDRHGWRCDLILG